MTKAELINEMAAKSGLKQAQAKAALEAFIGCVTEAARRGEDVRLVGFGNFTPVTRAAGKARNPRTGEIVQRAESRTIRFRGGEALKLALTGELTPIEWTDPAEDVALGEAAPAVGDPTDPESDSYIKH